MQIIYIQSVVIDERFLNTVWRTEVWQEVVQTASIITACIPFLKPFLMSLESGFLRADAENRRITAGLYGSKTHENTSSYVKMRDQQSRDISIRLQDSATEEER